MIELRNMYLHSLLFYKMGTKSYKLLKGPFTLSTHLMTYVQDICHCNRFIFMKPLRNARSAHPGPLLRKIFLTLWLYLYPFHFPSREEKVLFYLNEFSVKQKVFCNIFEKLNYFKKSMEKDILWNEDGFENWTNLIKLILFEKCYLSVFWK